MRMLFLVFSMVRLHSSRGVNTHAVLTPEQSNEQPESLNDFSAGCQERLLAGVAGSLAGTSSTGAVASRTSFSATLPSIMRWNPW